MKKWWLRVRGRALHRAIETHMASSHGGHAINMEVSPRYRRLNNRFDGIIAQLKEIHGNADE